MAAKRKATPRASSSRVKTSGTKSSQAKSTKQNLSCPIVGIGGSAGLRAIKAAGGLTFAQNQQSAKFDAMPRSAIRAGFVDLVLTPRDIAREIERIATHPYIRRPLSDPEEIEKAAYRQADDLGRIFLSLKKQMGVDFSAYKESTLIRRIQRRMALHRIDKLNQYARFLRDNKKEVEALFDDLLINVMRLS